VAARGPARPRTGWTGATRLGVTPSLNGCRALHGLGASAPGAVCIHMRFRHAYAIFEDERTTDRPLAELAPLSSARVHIDSSRRLRLLRRADDDGNVTKPRL